MPPSGLAIILGAGPTTAAGIARILSSPSHGNLAVALLARRPDPLAQLCAQLRSQAGPDAVLEAFPTDAASPDQLPQTFARIRDHESFRGLKLKLAVFGIKNSARKPFMTETWGDFVEGALGGYVGGAMLFAQESLKMMFEQNGGETLLSEGGAQKGTIIFTGTMGALRANAEFASYGASRSSVRQLSQALGKEFSPKGVHVVHTIINGRVTDADTEETRTGKHTSAEAVGKTYLWLAQQEPTLWTSELDLRPAQEKY